MEEREPVVIDSVKSAFILFETELKNAVDTLDNLDKVFIMRLSQLEGYTLPHSRGIYGLIYSGDEFVDRTDSIKSNVVIQKRNMLIGIVSHIKFFDNKTITLEQLATNNRMLPSDYVELAQDTLAGIEVINNRPEYERRIKPVRTTLVNEENGEWKYLTTFSIPLDFIEKSLRE
jgi:hypothetical protein